MNEIPLADLPETWLTMEHLVDATPDIDPWCSGPDWVLPAHQAFAPESAPLVLADEDHGLLALARYDMGTGPGLAGLEPLWGFASPLLGPNPPAVAAKAVEALDAQPDWELLLLPGQPVPDVLRPASERQTAEPADGGSSLLDGSQRVERPSATQTIEVAAALSPLGHVGFAEGITRQVIDLHGGCEAWLARRSSRFRRNLRRAEAAAGTAGLTIEDVSALPPEELFERLISLEHHSWKGQEQSGIVAEEMAAFYQGIIQRLHPKGRLRSHIASINGVDVGFILGGIRNRRYRGLQLSYAQEASGLSIGNLLQAHQLRQLTDLDLADTYDLGMDFDYKRRWADRAETSIAIVVQRGRQSR